MSSDRWTDLDAHLQHLADLARRYAVSGLVLRKPATLTWLLGARVHVPQTLDSACLDVMVDLTTAEPRVTVVTNAIEAPRLRDTELAGFPGEWLVVPWWESRDPMLPSGPDVGSDWPANGSVDLDAELTALRRQLTGRQQQQLRSLCRDTAEAATATAGLLAPTTTEYAAAGLFSRELLAREIDPIVLLVGGEHRMASHRHPLPTGSQLGSRGMLVACGRRHGLVSAVTRIVSFTPLATAQRAAYARLLNVEQAFLDATRAGARLGDVVAAGTAAYGEQGFDPDEWHQHHQGGFSGFEPREFPAHHSSTATIPADGVVAWNPSAAGWKVEDTTLVLETGPQLLVFDEQWPTVGAGDRTRPDVLTV